MKTITIKNNITMKPNYHMHNVWNFSEVQIQAQALKAALNLVDKKIILFSKLFELTQDPGFDPNEQLILTGLLGKRNSDLTEQKLFLEKAQQSFLKAALSHIDNNSRIHVYYESLPGESIEEKLMDEFRNYSQDEEKVCL